MKIKLEKDVVLVHSINILLALALLLMKYYLKVSYTDMRVYYWIYTFNVGLWLAIVPRKYDKAVILAYAFQVIVGIMIIFELF